MLLREEEDAHITVSDPFTKTPTEPLGGWASAALTHENDETVPIQLAGREGAEGARGPPPHRLEDQATKGIAPHSRATRMARLCFRLP
jgi:hypothetical protein